MSAGGVYHVAAATIPTRSITNKCIVLDLDLTLISTQDEVKSLKDLKILVDPRLISLRNRVYYLTIDDLEKPGIGTKYDFWGVTRPHIQEFLLFCFSYFKLVTVWSAGKRPYVEAIIDQIFKDLPKPHIVFSYDEIMIKSKDEWLKPLTKMIESSPISRKYMSLSNTLALDDNFTTFHLTNPENGVLIPAYLPALSVDALSRDDHALLQFKHWLLLPEVVNSPDVRLLDKSKIFSTSLNVYMTQPTPSYGFTSSI